MLMTANKPVHIAAGFIKETQRRRKYQQVDLEYHADINTLWTYMKPKGVPNFNLDMIEELHHNFQEIKQHGGSHFYEGDWQPVDYCVIASRYPGVFNFGGHLGLFISLIRSRDRDALMHYAKLCVDAIYTRLVNYDSSTVTISLVQGDALGGGFEFALSSNIIIAEKGVRMGFPEIIFNLFPGMGAYSFLSRRVGMRMAEQMLTTGNTYLAEDLEKMGVIDMVVPAGQGEKAVFDLIRKQGKRLNGLRSIYDCRRHIWPVSYRELINITSLWVDSALKLNDKDLHTMTRLVRSQQAQPMQKIHSIKPARERILDLVSA